MMYNTNPVQPYEGRESFLLVWSVKEDTPARETCCELLARSGYRLWYPVNSMDQAIAKLSDCCGVAAIFSPRSVCSHDFRKLITSAVWQHKPILAIVAEDAPLSPGTKAQLADAVFLTYQANMAFPPAMIAFHAAHGHENYSIQITWRSVAMPQKAVEQEWPISTMVPAAAETANADVPVTTAHSHPQGASIDFAQKTAPQSDNTPAVSSVSLDNFDHFYSSPTTDPTSGSNVQDAMTDPVVSSELEQVTPAEPATLSSFVPPAPPTTEFTTVPGDDLPPISSTYPPTELTSFEAPHTNMETQLVQMQIPKLILLETGEIIECFEGATTVGRLASTANVVLPLGTVSRQHLRILSVSNGSKDTYAIADCDSSNGTWVNGSRLDKGSTVQIEADHAFLNVGPELPALVVFGKIAEKLQPGVTILVLSCIETREDFLLLDGELPLGRGTDWPRHSLREPHISWQHACIHLAGTNASLTDVGSANGTWLNDQRLTPHAAVSVHHGDRIRLGLHHFDVRMLELKKRAE